ncbi:Crp/Fnr family transcriptional regulator [Streptomyces sp. DG2A-72]|uniref:Crp/Fnr family transcriptional regulator n=1 Tax=Streptomyces sp. DG2A-72 TaxID=3051386 RepID=UPI00265C41C5|nr:Crp/Fnr family transcriptional regulator [Streptomyces sp. DG2A-72]MDO0934065.1 Crp/Fnr family transcriptional regulator [Streptomyces sp. DG2A-72]
MDEAGARELIRDNCEAWRAASFLRALEPAALRALVMAGEPVGFGRAEKLMMEGERGTDVFLLMSSFVKVTAGIGGTGEALLAMRAGGDVVGEIAARDGGPRTATVTACGQEPVRAVRLSGPGLEQYLADRPEVRLQLERTVLGKFRTATLRRIDNSSTRARIRLARALVAMAEDFGTPLRGSTVIQVDLTQVEWGAMISCSEKTVERAMAELARHGLVERHRRRPIVRDLEALRALAYDGAPSS